MTQFSVRRPARRSGTRSPAASWPALFDDLFREMEFHRGSPAALGTRSAGVYPPVNLEETAEAYVLTAELPGVKSDEIDVSIEGTTVTLTGQRKTDSSAGNGVAVHRRERQSGHFKRAFELPGRIDVNAAEAVHKAGVLELRLPKAAEAKPRQIEIESR